MIKFIISFFILANSFFAFSQTNYYHHITNFDTLPCMCSTSMGNYVIQTKDKGYLISAFGVNPGYDFSGLIKYNGLGAQIWKKQIHTHQLASGQWLHEHENGEISLLSEISHINPLEPLLTRLDKNGNIIWSKYFFNPKDTANREWKYFRIFGMNFNSDSSYVLCGHIRYGNAYTRMHIIKANTNGDTLWRKIIVPEINSTAYCIKETRDKGYLISAGSDINNLNNGVNDFNLLICKTTSNGEVEWIKSFSNSSVYQGNSICKYQDSLYFIVGNTYDSTQISKTFLIKINDKGDTIWTKKFNAFSSNTIQSIGRSVVIKSNNNILVSSNTPYTNPNNSLKDYVNITELNENGDILYSISFKNDTGNIYGYALGLTNEDKLFFTGEIIDKSYKRSLYFVHPSNRQTGIDNAIDPKLNIYPNPTSETIEIPFTDTYQFDSFNIYSINGDKIFESNILLNTSSLNINLKNIVKNVKGYYILNLINSKQNYSYSKKIILE